MLETIIVIVIVLIAAGAAARFIYRSLTGKGTPCGKCGSCPLSDSCSGWCENAGEKASK